MRITYYISLCQETYQSKEQNSCLWFHDWLVNHQLVFQSFFLNQYLRIGETFRITVFWKYNKKRKLFSLSVWSMRTVSLQKRLEKYCDNNCFLWIETVIMFFSYDWSSLLLIICIIYTFFCKKELYATRKHGN